MDFVISTASDRIIIGLGPHLCITWMSMRPTGVWMVSVDQDDAFPGQHLLQLGTRSGYSTVVSRVSCSNLDKTPKPLQDRSRTSPGHSALAWIAPS